MKTTFTLTIILFLTIMLGMALSSSKPSRAVEPASPIKVDINELREAREWLISDRGTRYFYDCVEGVEYIATMSTHNHAQFAYTGKVCNTTDSNIEEK